MKTLAITTIIGVLVAVPLIFARRWQTLQAIPLQSTPHRPDVNLLYDVNDFITE